MRIILLLAISSICLSGCGALFVAGAGATAGAAATKEGGITTSAKDFETGALIKDAWFQYDTKTFSELSLTIEQGEVLITGVVQEPQQRVEAVRLAWGVKGVKRVINEIQISNPRGLKTIVKDNWITTQIRTKFTTSKVVQTLNFSIDTIAGTVYLMGYAHSQEELDAAIEIARVTKGVHEVVSYVHVVTDINASES